MSITSDTIRFIGKKGFFNIFPQLCKGCGLCKEKCPYDILDWSDELGIYGTPIVEPVDMDKCTACRLCENSCPDCAIFIEKIKKKEEK
ncbi:MAG: 4Fe-4S dicluster domain-containing protein [Candidatus Syntrophonatronum acetioxidans]|uniref:4Fe-4S dicluster domain-containing protein n=1 Tax=Candidatus Syntrophonatronum acetioxidans TaxID=1795816 RepID=A0A424Y9Y5_9FIRM|nr:MAG: 4Fe-4S dicluster domain-containing protein [Candidatus Syntrophonatronum acetioxidans]